MPTGFNSGQEGNALPLSGETEMRMASSGTDALTITGHSSMSTAADFLVLRTFVPEGTTGSASEKFVIGSSGELRQFKYSALNLTSGANAGQWPSTFSTVITLGASDSGKVLNFAGFASALRVNLPAPTPGMVFTIISASAHGAIMNVSATNAGAYDIRAPFRGSGLSTASVVSPPTTVAGMAAVFLAVSTLTWQLFPAINGIQGTSATGEISGCWISGTS